MLLHHLLDGRAEDDSREAIVDGDRRATYAEFKAKVETLAGRLAAAGIERGARVAILLPKSIEECVAIFAASRADAVFVPINPALRPAQVRHILQDSGAHALVTLPDLLAKLGNALDGLRMPAKRP